MEVELSICWSLYNLWIYLNTRVYTHIYIEHAYSLWLGTRAHKSGIITTYRMQSESRAGKMHTRTLWADEWNKKKTKRSRRKQRMHVHVQRATRTCFRLCECVCCWGHRSGRIAKRVTRMKCLARANTIYIRLSNFVPIFVLTLNVSSDSTYGDLRTCVRGEEVRLYILVATPTYYKLYCPWLLSK